MTSLKSYLGHLISSYDRKWSLSFFWKWLLFVHAPYLFTLGLTDILKSGVQTLQVLLFRIGSWVVFCCLAVLLNGIFIKSQAKARLGIATVPMVTSGFKIFIAMGVVQVLYFVPNYILSNAISFVVGFALAFTGNPSKLDTVSFSSGFVMCINYAVTFFILGAVSRSIALSVDQSKPPTGRALTNTDLTSRPA